MGTVKVFADGQTDGQSDYYRAPHFQCGGPNYAPSQLYTEEI